MSVCSRRKTRRGYALENDGQCRAQRTQRTGRQRRQVVEITERCSYHPGEVSVDGWDRRWPGSGCIVGIMTQDGWEHDLLVEKVLEPEPSATYPVCLKGRRACPPEDVGGIWGYAEFLQILTDPDHPEYEERLEWIGGEFDPEEFDVEDVNAALASSPYEHRTGQPNRSASPEVASGVTPRGHVMVP